MKLAFVLDPLEALKAYKDSSVAMMREARRRGHEVHALEARSMYLRGGRVMASVRRLSVTDDDHAWYHADAARDDALAGFDLVLMRKDPPFDLEYYNATLLLDRVEAEGARVVNRPRALRDWNEKLGILAFASLAPPTLVASDMARIHAFIDEHGDVVVKKLDGMGGAMIFRVKSDDVNRNVIVEAITDMGGRTVMAQRYIPEIANGDKRVLVIDGRAFPHCLARIPKAGETRGNLAAGGRGVAQPISARDREIAETIGPHLVKAGIVFAGLDVIGDWVTEINVTSPTCIVEIAQQTGRNAAVDLLDALERVREAPPSQAASGP
jgi:glutathione synthase